MTAALSEKIELKEIKDEKEFLEENKNLTEEEKLAIKKQRKKDKKKLQKEKKKENDTKVNEIEESKEDVKSEINEEKVEEKKENNEEKIEEKKKEKKLQQTYPPKIPITKLFPNKDYPTGEICEYKFEEINTKRKQITELKQLEKTFQKHYQNARLAAEAHRQVRKYIQNWVKPGMKMIDICEELESRSRLLVEENGLKAGIAFPTGCSINNCAAHWTPNPGDERVLEETDVVKFDFGTHIEGRIIDSAWTMCWKEEFNPLLEAVKAATNTGLKLAGIDVRMSEIGEGIQEVMESYEVTIKKKTYQVKAVKNLNGHSIELYKIHAGKSIPCIANSGNKQKMEENEFYAIETFGTTGKGYLQDDADCSHFMKDYDAPEKINCSSKSAKDLYKVINKEFSTLAFCRRYLDRIGEKKHLFALKTLVKEGYINDCPPLVDIPGSYVAQWEHTLVLKPTCKEILSRGNDY